MNAEREMTLKEWVERLPEFHSAHKEYKRLVAAVEVAPQTLNLHPRTADLVQRFAAALAEKLAAAQAKYGYSDNWASPDWMGECRAKLAEHVAKGDPRDVAAYCAFLWHHGERAAAPTQAAPADLEARIVQMAEEYELRGDEGDYTPNERERLMLLDFAHEVAEALFALQSNAGTEVPR